jgi:hypothetical protein
VQWLRFAGAGRRRDLDYVRCRAFLAEGRFGTAFASPTPPPAAATAPSAGAFRITFLLSVLTLVPGSILLVDELRTFCCRFFGHRGRRLAGSGELILAAVAPTPASATTAAALLLALVLLPLRVNGFRVFVDLIRLLFNLLGRLC